MSSVDGIPTIAYNLYAMSPQAIENGFSDELSPAWDKDDKTGKHIQRKSFYNNISSSPSEDPKLPPLTPMICAYPECSNMFWITLKQKREIKTYNVLKYYDSHDPYCSVACQEKHFRDLEESKCFDKRNMKNRVYALTVSGSDDYLLKRPKEKEIHLVTGNITEQRVGCLRYKLLSMSERVLKLKDVSIKAKFMYRSEIIEFIKNELPKDLRPSVGRTGVTASEMVTICEEVYPNEISFEWIDGNNRVLLCIK